MAREDGGNAVQAVRLGVVRMVIGSKLDEEKGRCFSAVKKKKRFCGVDL
jgi:hypothetical protein